MADGAPNCWGSLVFELTLPNERYATAYWVIREKIFQSMANVKYKLQYIKTDQTTARFKRSALHNTGIPVGVLF